MNMGSGYVVDYGTLSEYSKKTCYWGQFILLDQYYHTYFSNNQAYIYNVIPNKLKTNKSYKDLNTLQIIYEDVEDNQFEFDEERLNSNNNTMTEIIVKDILSKEECAIMTHINISTKIQNINKNIHGTMILFICAFVTAIYIII